jgi:hypothetical protein
VEKRGTASDAFFSVFSLVSQFLLRVTREEGSGLEVVGTRGLGDREELEAALVARRGWRRTSIRW